MRILLSGEVALTQLFVSETARKGPKLLCRGSTSPQWDCFSRLYQQLTHPFPAKLLMEREMKYHHHRSGFFFFGG